MNNELATTTPGENAKIPSYSDHRIRTMLVEAFPCAFMAKNKAKVPLMVGISKGLTAKLAEKGFFVRGWQLQRALAAYTSRPTYLREMVMGAYRVDLDGNYHGVVSQLDQDFSERQLAKIGMSFNKLQVAALNPDEIHQPGEVTCQRFGTTRTTPPGLACCDGNGMSI